MAFKVKEVADLVGISVRTLHHYDQIGLLKPESVSPAGYRLYGDSDLERLQQILLFKEIGFDLQEIKRILDHPYFDRRQALFTHREILLEKKKRLDEMIGTVEKTLRAMEGESVMDKKEMFSGFDMGNIEEHQARYAEETREKYGNTDAYRESVRKTSRYAKEDWAKITADGERIYREIAALMDCEPGNIGVQLAVGEWRRHICDHYYDCTPEIFRGLADLYVQDTRFTENIDKVKPGLATFLSEAMRIYYDNLKN